MAGQHRPNGARRRSDHVAGRRFITLHHVPLESGVTLPAVDVAYEAWGAARCDGTGRIINAVLVLHALTGDSHVTGPAGEDQPTPGWWSEVVGPGKALDTDRWYVLCPNVLGGCRGTSGPSSIAPDGRAWGSRFPDITVRDQVSVEARFASYLGIDSFASVIGGSMGGMRALEWTVGHPERVGSALLLATSAQATADQLGTQAAQILAITQDPAWQGGDYHATAAAPESGLGLARRIAHLTYRTDHELDVRFGRDLEPDGRFAVESWLDHHADKLVHRFDAGAYVALTKAMNSHDIGRGRGGVAAALASVRVPVVVGGVDSDRLYPLRLQQQLSDLIPTAAPLQVIRSPYGHDGFLLESEQVGGLIARTLALASTDQQPAVSSARTPWWFEGR